MDVNERKVGDDTGGAMTNIVFRDNDIVQARRGVVVEGRHGGATIDGVLIDSVRVERLITTQERYPGAKVALESLLLHGRWAP